MRHLYNFAVLDLETAGSDIYPPPMEIAAVFIRDGYVSESFSTLVNPLVPIPPFVARMTGISDDMVQTAPVLSDVLPDLIAAFSGHVLVAHDAEFDVGVLRFHAEKLGIPFPSAPILCTMRLSKTLFPDLGKYNLDFLLDYFGIPCIERHRALGDALGAARLTLSLLDLLESGNAGAGDIHVFFQEFAQRKEKKKRSRRPRAAKKKAVGAETPVEPEGDDTAQSGFLQQRHRGAEVI
ncbi:MAG: 3'-5' exonuclease [Armatimonadetes bacterium]|nr:3'-5' exonuclease [Armatimonadota bacterium]